MTLNGKLIHSKLTMGHGKCQTDEEVSVNHIHSPCMPLLLHAHHIFFPFLQLDNIIDKIKETI